MSRNIYKIKKYKHFEELQEINFYKPLCCIVISNIIKNNKEFYKNLFTTLNFLAHTCPYICIYIFNKNKINDSNEFVNVDENKPFFKMVFKNIEHETITTDIDKFIPTITNVITKINDSIIFQIQKSLNENNNNNNNNNTNEQNSNIQNNSNKSNIIQQNNNEKQKTKKNIDLNKNSKNKNKLNNIIDNKNIKKENTKEEYIKDYKEKEFENDEEINEEEFEESDNDNEDENDEDENDEDDISLDEELINNRLELERKRKILENL